MTSGHCQKTKETSVILSNELISAVPSKKTVVVAGDLGTEDKVSYPETNTSILRSDHEEADTRVILHCIHSSAKHIVASARDTDIASLLLAHFILKLCETLVKNWKKKVHTSS